MDENQTNDNLLPGGLPTNLSISQQQQNALQVKTNTKYIQIPMMINAYCIRDLIENPALTAIYGLAGLSMVRLSEREILVQCKSCGSRAADIDDFVVRAIQISNKPVYDEENGMGAFHMVKENAPFQIVKREFLLSTFVQLPNPVPAEMTWTMNGWVFDANN